MLMPFMNGQGLFLTESIGEAHIMREMRDDFGILPYPKYDEAQESYQTYICDGDACVYTERKGPRVALDV